MYKPVTDPSNFVIANETAAQRLRRPNRYKRAILNLSLAVGSVVFGLVLCEVVLRVFSPGYSPLFLDIYRMDDAGILMLEPNIERRHLTNEFDVKVVTNADGLRDWATPSSDKTKRVVGVGDSMAFGWGVELEQSLYALTEQSFDPNEIRIVKAGIPATSTIDQIKWLQQYGDSYQPRAVVVSFCVFNDFTDNLVGGVPERFTVRDGLMVWFDKPAASEERSRAKAAWELRDKIKRSSLLVQKAAQVWWYFDTKIVNPEDRNNPGLTGKGGVWENGQIYLKHSTFDVERSIEVTLKSLDDIQRWCEERKIPLVLLVIPHSLQLYQWELSKWLQAYDVSASDFDVDRPQRILSEWGAKKKVTVADLLPHFRAYQASHPDERLYFYPDVHMNARGHREAASVLQDALKTALRSPSNNSSPRPN